MNEQDYREAKNQCYALAHSLGANKSEQESLVNALHDIELEYDGGKKERLIACMLGVFTDGLYYGNWPWTKV